MTSSSNNQNQKAPTPVPLFKYGTPPFDLMLIHGGPGACGEMEPIAKQLQDSFSILEPFSVETTISEQVNSLAQIIETENKNTPITVLGYSWGAWMACILAANYPQLINKLILVGSGPFEEKYVAEMKETRFNRLSPEQQAEAKKLMATLESNSSEDKQEIGEKLGALFGATDSYSKVELEFSHFSFQPDTFSAVMPEGLKLRKSGKLLDITKQVKCPVYAIHGDYDPHPYKGVHDPLSKTIRQLEFLLLEKCGHTPWAEIYGSGSFYQLLNRIISIS